MIAQMSDKYYLNGSQIAFIVEMISYSLRKSKVERDYTLMRNNKAQKHKKAYNFW